MQWKTANVQNSRGPNPSELVDFLDWKSTDEYISIRLIGPINAVAQHWIKIRTQQKKIVNIPKLCLNYDNKTDTFNEAGGCPYCKDGIPHNKSYVQNAIVRDLQDNAPRKPPKWTSKEEKQRTVLGYSGFFKDKKGGSKSWTPVRVILLPFSVARKIVDLAKVNRRKMKDGTVKTYDIDDPKYGCDIAVRYDGSKAGVAKYDVQKDHRSPITEEELDYLLYDLNIYKAESLTQAKDDWEKLKAKYVETDKDGEVTREGFKKRKGKNEDDDDELEDDVDLDDDDEEDRPKKKNKKSGKVKAKRSRDDDDDDADLYDLDDDDNSDDDEDEDEPRRSKKGKKKAVLKKRRRDDDDDDDDNSDDDEDEDNSDDDEDEDEEPRRKSTKTKKRKVEDDDEEETPRRRTKVKKRR